MAAGPPTDLTCHQESGHADDKSQYSDCERRPKLTFDKETLGQVVLVFQGGGALGAYQAGVYEAMQEVGLEPDWVIGTSIGAINASLIAGNPPGKRLARLQEFWRRIEHGPFRQMAAAAWGMGSTGANAMTMAAGVDGFFQPNPLGLHGARGWLWERRTPAITRQRRWRRR